MVVLVVVALDALSDGLRAKLQRPWTVTLGCLGDGLALWMLWPAIGHPTTTWEAAMRGAIMGAMVGLRLSQELSWHKLPWHKGTRFDMWHIGKSCRFMPPLIAIVALSGLAVWQMALLAAGSWVLWRLVLMLARGTWNWRRPWA